MATIRGPIKVISGGIATRVFVDKVAEKADAGEIKFTMPFEAQGWESAKNADMIIGKKPVIMPVLQMPPETELEIEKELPIENKTAIAKQLIIVADLEAIKGISKAAAIKLVNKYKYRDVLISAIKANSVPELDKIRLGILRKAMGA